MHDSLLRNLQELRPTILERWETLLRAEPVTSPLANPDSLVYMMNWTLDRFFTALRGPLARRRLSERGSNKPAYIEEKALCACKMNPLLAYFATAEQALVQVALPLLQPRERESILSAVRLAMQAVAKREIDTFCAVCQRRPDSEQTKRCASAR
ncbi:MAG: hypothetical protein QM790_08840 [Nibricoccus sp.]